jgi:hypothetical protein
MFVDKEIKELISQKYSSCRTEKYKNILVIKLDVNTISKKQMDIGKRKLGF